MGNCWRSEAWGVRIHSFMSGTSDARLQSVLQGHTGSVTHVAFAHSGFLIATGGDGTTRLWDGVSGEALTLATGPGFSAFSPDDDRLAFATGEGIGVWDVCTAPERKTLHAGMTGNRAERWVDRGVLAAVFSPDEKLLATAAYDGVRFWDPDSGGELADLKVGRCKSVLFDPDDRGLITSGGRGTYRWPIRPDSAHGPDAISIGPPQLLWESTTDDEWHCASWLPDHRTLAIVDNARTGRAGRFSQPASGPEPGDHPRFR